MRELTIGFYQPSPKFRAVQEHTAVIDDNMTVVALTGPAHDPESERYARLFAAAPELLEALRMVLMAQTAWDDGQKTPPQIELCRLAELAQLTPIDYALSIASAALASVEPPALFSIWQRFKDEVLGNGQWGLWACTYHINLTETDARAKLAEIEADELERRERCPDTMAIYEIRPATKGGE